MKPRITLLFTALISALAITSCSNPQPITHSTKQADMNLPQLNLTPRNISKSSADGAKFQNWENYFKIENIPTPNHINPQIGGLTITKDDRVAVVFHGGHMAIYQPKNGTWQDFASGLHEPLGVMEDNNGDFLVMQRAELTKLIDEDKDGQADFYKNMSNDFGFSGNYHEFAFGPTQDQQGNYYYALNVASNFAGTFKYVRGEFSQFCMDHEIMANYQNIDWKNLKVQAGRMFSCVPYRGWIMKLTPEGETIPYASGFRSPNGITIDAKNRMWVTDNQGDYIQTSPLHHVEEGDFAGHPASLNWKEGQKVKPLDMSIAELDKLRKPAAALFTHAELANSPTEPVPTTLAENFGLPKDELLIGDMNQFNLIRYLPDFVNGVAQGTLIPFLQSGGLGRGNHRMAFDQKGDLWIGKIHLTWAGDEGIRKVSWNKEPYLIADKVTLTEKGFAVHFNHPIKGFPEELEIEKHTYQYDPQYGGPKVNLQDVIVTKQTLSTDGHWLNIEVDSLSERYLYTITLTGVTNKNGKPLMGDVLRYNLINKR